MIRSLILCGHSQGLTHKVSFIRPHILCGQKENKQENIEMNKIISVCAEQYEEL